MKNPAEVLIGLIILFFALLIASIVFRFFDEVWPALLLILVFGLGLFFFLCWRDYADKKAEKEKEKADARESQKKAQALEIQEKNEKEIRLKLVSEQELDKKISLTNDYLNTNLERYYQKSLIANWIGMTLQKYPIKHLTKDLYSEVYSQTSGKLLAEYSTSIFKSIYEEWYRYHHPEITFIEIQKYAKSYAGGTSEKLSTLELYTSYIALEMLNMMTISHDLQKEMIETIQALFNDSSHRKYNDSYRERKVLKDDDHYILSAKIAFLLMSVFYLNREGMSINGRVPDRKKQAEDIDSIVSDIESVKEVIIKNQNFYQFLQKSKQGSDELINFVEIEIAKLDAGDTDFLEKANAIIDRIDEELNG